MLPHREALVIASIGFPHRSAMNGSPTCCGYSTGTATATRICPHCGCLHESASIIYYWTPPATPKPRIKPWLTPAELERLRRLALEQSRLAIQDAQGVLRGLSDDPMNRVSLQDRQRPYARPRAKKRVCAGSARYRVLVN